METAQALLDAFESAGHRPTAARRALAELVAAREGTFTAADLSADARSRGLMVGRATVFRSIEVLERVGAIERVDLPSGEHAYVPCVGQHHHHVICSRCGRATEIGDVGLASLARDVARRTGYRVDEHRLELFGLCPDCQAARRPAPGTA